MALPQGFQFSQNSFQDYIDCQRRFQLRYLLYQPWPAVESEPLADYERLMDLGRRFHQLAQRYSLGFAESDLIKSIGDTDLRRWWRNYVESPPPDLPTAVRRPEVTLSAPLGGYRITARYDLLALEPGRRAIIVDWKTNRKRPTSAWLAQRLQTHVYRYVLVEAGTALNDGIPLSPGQVTMVYWFAEHPGEPEILAYDAAQYSDDGALLADLSARIVNRAATDFDDWPLTSDERLCLFCTYRSLCRRGVKPGNIADFDADQALEISFDLEFEQIEEIEY